MKNHFSLKAKLIGVAILPLILIGLTSIISLHYLEDSNFDILLESKHNYYQKTLQSLISAKGNFLTFSATLVRQNKNLIRSLKSGDKEQIAQNTDNVWNQISDTVQVLFFWQEEQGAGKILYFVGLADSTDRKFQSPFLSKIAKSKRAGFSIEKSPDGKIRLMQASAYFNAPGKPYNLVVQGLDIDIILKELQNIIGTAQVSVQQLEHAEKHKHNMYKDSVTIQLRQAA
jgi:hypothetical protein